MSSDFILLLLSVVVSVFCSLVYWYNCKKLPLKQRILISAHGVIFAIGFIYAILISNITEYGGSRIFLHVFFVILMGGILSIIVSLVKYPYSKPIHLIQLLNLVSVLFIYAVGGMSITHDWI